MKNIQKNLIFTSLFVLGAISFAPAVFAGTPPSLQTNPATNITQTSASLNGFYNTNGTNTNVWFQYGNTPLMSQTTPFVTKTGGTSGNYSTTIVVTPGATIYFRAFGDNLYGPGYGETFNFTAPGYPEASVQTNPVTDNTTGTSATLNGYFNSNGADVSTQFEYGATNALGSTTALVNQANLFGNFSEAISTSANTTYYFRAVAVNGAGVKSYGTILSFTTPNANNNSGNGVSAPSVTTYSASNLTISSAYLSGAVNANNSTVYNCWFEYGINSNDLNQTSSVSCSISSSGSFATTIYGLSSNTTYYFRACAQNSSGQNCGSTLNFYTQNSYTYNSDYYYYPPAPAPYYPPITPIVTAASYTPPSQTASPTIIYRTATGSGLTYITLSITPATASVRRGEEITYVISYKNISGRSLNDAILNIKIPEDETFLQASQGVYSSGERALIVDLGTIDKGESGDISVKVVLSRTARVGDMLVAQATLSFTQGTLNSREDATVYSTTAVISPNLGLGGLALFSGFGFFPHTLWGWLILAALLYIVVLIATRVYDERKIK